MRLCPYIIPVECSRAREIFENKRKALHAEIRGLAEASLHKEYRKVKEDVEDMAKTAVIVSGGLESTFGVKPRGNAERGKIKEFDQQSYVRMETFVISYYLKSLTGKHEFGRWYRRYLDVRKAIWLARVGSELDLMGSGSCTTEFITAGDYEFFRLFTL